MDTGVIIALILGGVQVLTALIAWFVTISNNRNKKLKKRNQQFAREKYLQQIEILSLLKALKEESPNKGIFIKDEKILSNLRDAVRQYLHYNTYTPSNNQLKELIEIDNLPEEEPVEFDFLDKRKI